jgi:broad specificity phosphatase PhoE
MKCRFLRSAVPVVLCLVGSLPAGALDTIYLVRHAEKVDAWPADAELDALRPLSPAGTARAEALADRLKDAGIAAVYTSRTTRTLATAMPLVERLKVPVHADPATTAPAALPAFLQRLSHDHPRDRAVLIVGHANTLPLLLNQLGAAPDCYARLGIAAKKTGPEVEGYEGLWKVNLKQHGCAAVTRE